MKLLLSAALAAGLTVTGFAQKTETLTGNGKLTSREVTVQSFDELKASGVYELRLSQGAKESVKIDADENLQELVTVTNTGNTLIVDMKKMDGRNIKPKNKTVVHITFKKLRDLELKMVGNVSTENRLTFDDLDIDNASVGNVALQLAANKLKLTNASVGNTTISGSADEAVVKNSSVGNLHAGELVVATMNIDNSGIGNAEVNATKDLRVKDNFLGKVKNKGTAAVRRSNRVVI